MPFPQVFLEAVRWVRQPVNNPSSLPIKFFFIMMVFMIFFCKTSRVAAQDSSDLKIQTQSYFLDQTNEVYTYTNATLEWADIHLEAGEIKLDRKNQKLTATHFVRFIDSRVIAILDRLEIDLKTQRGIFYNVALFDATTQAYLTAEELHKIGKLHFIAKTCSLTTCETDKPAWQIKGQEVHYQGENFSSAQGATLLVNDIPVFYFPYLLWPTVSKRQSGFLAPDYQVLNSKSAKFDLGFKLRIPYFWAIADDQDLTILTDYIEQRGIGAGVEYQYAFREGLRGELKFWQIRERNERNPALESGRLEEEEISGADLRPLRFKMEFNHSQAMGDRTQFIVAGQIFSDSQFQREYERIREPNPNYAQHLNVSVSRQFDKGDLSILIDRELVYEEIAILNRNFIETRIQRLPEIAFQYSDRLWSSPLIFETSGVASRFHRDDGLVGWREIIIPRLHYNFSLLQSFDATLSFGKRLSYYQVNNPGNTVFYEDLEIAMDPRENKEFSHGIDVMEAEIRTTFSRIWTVRNEIFSRFKHLVTPRVLFESSGDVNQDKSRPIVLPTLSNPDPDPVDFFDKEDSIPGKQLLIFRLDNLLLAKKHLQAREVTLTQRSMKLLKDRQLDHTVLSHLKQMVNQKFLSESEFLSQLTTILERQLTPEQEALILSYTQKGVRRHSSHRQESSSESSSWVLSRLNLIQRINLFHFDKNYAPKGPLIEDQETEPGESLLPLEVEWSLHPGPRFSVDFFLRYNYQDSRVVESKATFNVRVSPNNQALIRFHNNENSYRTPDDIFHEKTNTLSFGSIFEANDDLSFGFNGKLNLNVSDEEALRRRLFEDALFVNYHPRCYIVRLIFKESAERTVTSGGEVKEIVDPSISLTITLGQVLPLPEQQFHF
ncbi:MAG: LPS-assembly protein LptD [SAR324 cluster bacterium]|nr:LPS-assembly protein LptD [SAR324 cluster bacterium]